jgi:hypothetical protein
MMDNLMAGLFSIWISSAVILTYPLKVNFMELPIKFIRTYFNLLGSVLNSLGIDSPISQNHLISLRFALTEKTEEIA